MPYTKMAEVPSPLLDTNGNPASGYVLKAYDPGTTDNISLATDNTGGTTVSTMTTNSDGIWEVSGNEVLPHIDRQCKWGIFATAAAATADTPFYMGPFDTVDQSASAGQLTSQVFYTSNYSTFSDAVTAAAGAELVVDNNNVIASNITVSGLSIRRVEGGNLDPNTSVTVTLNCPIQSDLGALIDPTAAGSVAGTFQVPTMYLLWLGADKTGVTSAVSKLNAALSGCEDVTVTTGTYLIDSAQQLSKGYDTTLRGYGESSIFKLGASGELFHKSTTDQNEFGHRRKCTISDLAFDGQSQTAVVGVRFGETGGGAGLAGTDSQVIRCLFTGIQTAILCTFVENILIEDVRAFANDYGVRAEDASGESAAGIRILRGNYDNNDLAGIAYITQDSNVGQLTIENAYVSQNQGFGAYIRGQNAAQNLPVIIRGSHFEENGKAVGNITIDSQSLDPQHLYLRDISATIDDCFFASSGSNGPKIVTVSAYVHFSNCKFGGGNVSIFDADQASFLTLQNCKLNTAQIETTATIDWGIGNEFTGASGTTWTISCRIPKRITTLFFPLNYIDDPTFEGGTSASIGGSASNNPTVTSSDTTSFIGQRSMSVVYNAGAGAANDNAIMLFNSQTVASGSYIVVTFFARSATNITLEVRSSGTQNLGAVNVNLTDDVFNRHAVVIYNPYASATETLWVHPKDAGGGTVFFDALQVSIVDTFDKAEALLAGGVSNLEEDRGVATFTANATTPDLSGASTLFKTANSSPTTIANFANAVKGKRYTVIVDDTNTTFDFSASNLKGNAGVDLATPAQYTRVDIIFDGTLYYCTVETA